MASNIEKLGETLQGRMHSVKKAGRNTLMELASIGTGGRLEPDASPGPIPKGEYSVCKSVSGRLLREESEGAGSGSGGIRCETLKAGDRVLLAWCGSEPVVIDLIVEEGGDEDAG